MQSGVLMVHSERDGQMSVLGSQAARRCLAGEWLGGWHTRDYARNGERCGSGR